MRTNWNAPFNQELHNLSGPTAALKLDHVRTRLHQHGGTSDRLFFAFLVAAKGQIAHHPGGALHAAQTTRHRFGVISHVL